MGTALSAPKGGSTTGAVAVLLGAAAWGSTGTATHFAPARASSASIGAARIVLGGAVLLDAVYAVTAARLISTGSSETVVMGALFGGAAILLAPVLAATSTSWLLTGRGVAVTACLGLVTTVAAYLLYGRGLRALSAPVAVTLGLAEPVVAALLGVVVLGERLTGAALAGVVLVGFAIVILTSGRRPAVGGVSTGPPG